MVKPQALPHAAPKLFGSRPGGEAWHAFSHTLSCSSAVLCSKDARSQRFQQSSPAKAEGFQVGGRQAEDEGQWPGKSASSSMGFISLGHWAAQRSRNTYSQGLPVCIHLL